MNYDIQEHKHRFSAWAASRAASVVNNRFKVHEGKCIIESAGIAKTIEELPEADLFDDYHEQLRKKVIVASRRYGYEFTHGVAAKLINIYLKSMFVCTEEYNNPKVKAIHPPIDSVLLDTLYKEDIGGQKERWNITRQVKWSKLSDSDYVFVINTVKIVMLNQGLWEIEQYWKGFQ